MSESRLCSLTLSPEELSEITGARRVAGQMEWLLQQGIPAAVGRDGRVKVLRAAVDAKLMPGTATRTRAKTEPNFALMKKAS